MGRTRKLSQHEMNPDSTATTDTLITSLYWCGMLPAQGTFKLKRPSREKDKQTGDYYSYVDATSEELWNGEVNQWVGRCPWKQSLSVNGFSFDAFSETLHRAVGSTDLIKTSYPGAVVELDEERAKAIIASTFKNVIRLREGRGVEISLDQPKSYMMLDNGSERVTKEAFNQRTDTYHAHYMYMVKLEASPLENDQSSYNNLVDSWGQFFQNPPASIAEVWTLKDGKLVEINGKASEA